MPTQYLTFYFLFSACLNGLQRCLLEVSLLLVNYIVKGFHSPTDKNSPLLPPQKKDVTHVVSNLQTYLQGNGNADRTPKGNETLTFSPTSYRNLGS